MTSQAEAAMAAVETALTEIDNEAEAAARDIARAQEAARSDALDLILAHFRVEPRDTLKVLDALDTLANEFGHEVVDHDEAAARDWEDGPLTFDENQLDTARHCAQRGAIADTLHHLERALPEGYGEIAERLARHVERSTP